MLMQIECGKCAAVLAVHVPENEVAKVTSEQQQEQTFPGSPTYSGSSEYTAREIYADRSLARFRKMIFLDGTKEPVMCPSCGQVLGDGTTKELARRLHSFSFFQGVSPNPPGYHAPFQTKKRKTERRRAKRRR